MVYLHMIIAGLVGTVVMSVVIAGIHRSGWADADMIRALGALMTRSYENAFMPGLAVHYAAGALIADNHPLERFRNVGLDVAAAHVVGHAAYGFGVGATCALLGFVSETAL